MDRLWSPWRLAYITSGASQDRCVFCEAAVSVPASTAPVDAPDDLVVARGATAFVILNLYPYNNGHLMVVPRRHFASLVDATNAELTELMLLTRDAEQVLKEVYNSPGINVGINLGQAAGAGIADHLHVHLVPRWLGDTNFISVIGETRVLPETFGATAARLRPAFERVLAARSTDRHLTPET